MATSDVIDGGMEAVVEVPESFLGEVLQESISDSLLRRGFALLPLSPAAKVALDRLRVSQADFFNSSPEKLKEYSNCHAVHTHGLSQVQDLKFYFQARSGGPNSHLPFPGPQDGFKGDFGIDILDFYTHMDLLGRACIKELAPALKLTFDQVSALLDPLAPVDGKVPDINRLSTENILSLPYKSHREGKEGWSELMGADYISSSNLDLFFYHNKSDTRTKWALNHPSHTDSGIISFIPISKVSALEFYDQKMDCWIALEEIIHKQAPTLNTSYTDYVVAMAGDTLQQIAKNSFKAGLHRVARTEEARESVVYKQRGRPELVGPKYEVDYKIVNIQRVALGLPAL